MFDKAGGGYEARTISVVYICESHCVSSLVFTVVYYSKPSHYLLPSSTRYQFMKKSIKIVGGRNIY